MNAFADYDIKLLAAGYDHGTLLLLLRCTCSSSSEFGTDTQRSAFVCTTLACFKFEKLLFILLYA
jgi:hypothetical protein